MFWYDWQRFFLLVTGSYQNVLVQKELHGLSCTLRHLTSHWMQKSTCVFCFCFINRKLPCYHPFQFYWLACLPVFKIWSHSGLSYVEQPRAWLNPFGFFLFYILPPLSFSFPTIKTNTIGWFSVYKKDLMTWKTQEVKVYVSKLQMKTLVCTTVYLLPCGLELRFIYVTDE